MISMDQFTHADPTRIYRQMRPDQWTAIANEFLRLLTIAGDPQADRFAAEVAPTNQLHTPTPPKTLEQAVAIHTYTRDHHPNLFAQVTQHPVTVASLEAPGAPTEPEIPPEEKAIVVGPDSAMDMHTMVPETQPDQPATDETRTDTFDPPYQGARPAQGTAPEPPHV